MKYDVQLSLYGKKYNFKDIEAACQEDAIDIAKKQAKQNIMFCAIQPSPEKRDKTENATQIPPMSGEEMFKKYFRKN
jgi:hypothetical protein